MTIHVFPGMGADKRIWNGCRDYIGDAAYHDWIPRGDAVTLEDYCVKLVSVHRINGGDVLIGVSMGGMVAAQIAHLLNCPLVIQVSSCTNIAQLNKAVKFLSPLGRIFPFGKMAHVPNAIIPNIHMKLTNDMYKESDMDFLKWSCGAVMAWGGVRDLKNHYSILGDSDFLFPLKKQNPTDVIEGGTHLMVLTHAEIVGKFIKTQLTRR